MMTARVPKVFLAMALGLALISAMGVASANVLRWDLQNVTFLDGGTASGFFLFDADASLPKSVVDWDITLGGGNATWPFPAFRFTPTTGIGGNESFPGVAVFQFFSNESFNDS